MSSMRLRVMSWASGGVLLLLLLLTGAQVLGVLRMGGGVEWWAMVLPMPFYLVAMAASWWSLRLLAKGAGLAPTLAILLRRAGIALFLGGLVEVFGTNMLRAAGGAGGQPVNITAIVIGVIGVGLYGIAGLIDEARAARAELDEFI